VTRLFPERTRWLAVVGYAIAMAWVEAACVYYLRVLVDRVEPYQANPLPMQGVLGQVELVREAATLIMLGAVGVLAGRTRRAQVGYAAVAFGVWDIFYYVFLRVMVGWPRSVLDWDVLFLLPLPWWGPVLAPVLIASLMVVGGTLASQYDFDYGLGRRRGPSSHLPWLGMALALYVFMADSLHGLHQGLDVTKIVPQTFNWILFCIALALMAAPLAQSGWRVRDRSSARSASI